MAIDPYNCRLPAPAVPVVDPATGLATVAWWSWARSMFARSGGDGAGIATVDVQDIATGAATAAAAAQTAANAAQAGVTAEAVTRAGADNAEATARIAADSTETAARIAADAAEATVRAAADALLAPKANPTFTGAIQLPILFNAINDAAAAAGGVAIGQLYRNNSVVMQRIV